MNKCVSCGEARLKKGHAHHEIKVGGQTFEAALPAMVCGKCDENYVTSAVLGAFELAVACHLATHGPVSGKSFRFMRKAIGLSAKAIAELLGTVPETVSRWENGQRDVDAGSWVTLGSLVLDERDGRHTTRDRLAAIRERATERRVEIKLSA